MEALQAGLRMFTAAIGREGEPNRGRSLIGAWAAIAYIGPEPSALRSSVAWCEHRDGGVVGMKPGRGEHVSAHRLYGGEQGDQSAEPAGEGGAVEIDAVASIDLGLSVERRVIAIFRDQHMGMQTGSGIRM